MENIWTDTKGWPVALFANFKSVSVFCSPPEDTLINKTEWIHTLKKATNRLGHLQKLNIPGRIAVSCVLSDLDLIFKEQGIQSIAYAQDNSPEPVYNWPEIPYKKNPNSSLYDFSHLPFGSHKWQSIDVYHGNFGQVKDVEFNIKNALFVRKQDHIQQWFVLLETWVFEEGNDAILQKMPLVEVFPDQSYQAHDWEDYLENAAGGDYNWIISDPTVSVRGDIIARLPNHVEFTKEGTRDRYVIRVLDDSAKTFRQLGSFLSPDPELIAAGNQIKNGSDHSFKFIEEILALHGFSDIQLNIRNQFEKSSIIAFKHLRKGTGHIIECKLDENEENIISLREAHVLAAKTSIDKGVLVTTGDLARPLNFHDNIWGLEVEKYTELIEWLRTFKSFKKGIYF
jgi:hypothetical protein